MRVASPFNLLLDNFVVGHRLSPEYRGYFENLTQITGKPLCRATRTTAADIELVLDATHATADSWCRTYATDRANPLNRIAD